MTDIRKSDSQLACLTCRDWGIVLHHDAGTWELCPLNCGAAQELDAELQQGLVDIKAGRTSKEEGTDALAEG